MPPRGVADDGTGGTKNRFRAGYANKAVLAHWPCAADGARRTAAGIEQRRYPGTFHGTEP